MKKIILLFAFGILLISNNAFGQTEKGNWLLGGNASFESSDGSSYITVSPNLGYFLSDNLAAGLNATFITGEGTTVYGIAPFVRPYFGSSSSGKLFAQASAGVFGFSSDFGSDSDFGWSASVGYAIFLNQSVALEIAPTYSKSGDAPGTFSIGVGFQIHFMK